jgi:hypothetical protein
MTDFPPPMRAALSNSIYASHRSLTFDGISDWMANFNIFGVSTFPIRRFNSVTVNMWVKSTKNDASTEQVIISRWFPFNNIAINEGGWRWYLWNAVGGGNPLVNRALVFQVNTWLLEGLWIYSQASFPLDTWVNVTMTYDGSAQVATGPGTPGLKMYWDGVWQPIYVIWSTWTTNALNSNAYSHLLWGTQYTAFPGGVGPIWPPVLTYSFEALMDESSFWRHTLTPTEVLHLSNAGYPADPLHVGLPSKKVDRYFRMGEWTDTTPWVLGHSISWDRMPISPPATLSNGFWNNDGVLPSLRVSEDVAP